MFDKKIDTSREEINAKEIPAEEKIAELAVFSSKSISQSFLPQFVEKLTQYFIIF